MKTPYSIMCAGALALILGACDKVDNYSSCYNRHFEADDGKLMECVVEVRERACRGKQDTPNNLFDGETGKPLTEYQKCLDQQQELEVGAAKLYYAGRFK